MPPAPAIVIAAGGAGRRMGGGKAERLLGGVRLLDRAIDWARRQSDCLALAMAPGGTPEERSERGDLPLLSDRVSDAGPIAALDSAMRFAAGQGREHVLLIGCDMPFLPADLIPRLRAAIGPTGAALPRRDGRLHTLAGLWHSDPAGLAAWIAGGGRSLWGYAEQAGLVVIDWEAAGPDPFTNLNTPADLAAAEVWLTSAGR